MFTEVDSDDDLNVRREKQMAGSNQLLQSLGLAKTDAEQDIYQIQKDWDTLNNRRSVRAARQPLAT